MIIRSKNSYQQHLYDFMHEVLVVCPSCSGQAIVRSNAEPLRNLDENETRIVCPKCGYSKKLQEKAPTLLMTTNRKQVFGRVIRIGGLNDPYFGLPLWLKTDCCGYTLWAYNYQHLQLLKVHVQAYLRQRSLIYINNKSIGSRLPKWMTAAKNRGAVLRAIELLEKK